MRILKHLLVAALCSIPLISNGVTITLGGPPDAKQATLTSATLGAVGTGNGTVTNVQAAFPALGPWTEINERTSAGTSGVFKVALSQGNSWGGAPTAGTWEILDPLFWSKYGSVAISMHVGNGQGDPDHFIWLIEQGQLSGTWSYDLGQTGLSNLKLYAGGRATTTVPDGGSTLMLLGLALGGAGTLRRYFGK